MKLFFDESGKLSTPPMIMGGVLIPKKIYNLNSINKLNEELRNNIVGFHFTDYNGNKVDKQNILKLIDAIAPYLEFIGVNIFYYENKDNIQKDLFKKMMYSKFPERIFYGLLRGCGHIHKTEVEIFMEDASEYKDLSQKFKESLNVQAVYRGANFKVEKCKMVPKGEEIGVEFTDLILGIIRFVIDKPRQSKGYIEKSKLVNMLLENIKFKDFIKSINYFEWRGQESLREIDFNIYLKRYIVRNLNEINDI